MKSTSGKTTRLGCWLLAGALASQVLCAPVLAALGGDLSTVENDRQRMKGELRTTAAAGYTVHEIQSSANMVVREYVTTGGRVFAVSWHGPVLPNMQQMLGAYFDDYTQAASAAHAGHRHLSIDRQDLVVHSNGRLRSFYGYAYLPALLPANFTPEQIK